MARLDPRLRFLRRERATATASTESMTQFGMRLEAADSEPGIRVLLHFQGSLDAARTAGFRPTSVAGDVAAGFTTFGALDALEGVENVTLIESSRPMRRELHISIPEVRADRLHSATPPCRGSSVIVGLIDSGIDFRHGCFLDSAGNTRVIAIWDQILTPEAGEASPAAFSYGVEYTRADIDAVLTGGGSVRHVDRDAEGHGTHVAGIAAGNGSVAGHGLPAGRLVGVAPEADLIVVANRADSADTQDAVVYLLEKAASLGRPIVINLSQGENLGPHDGTSPLERAIDNLLGGPGVAMVKSAGNAGNAGLHAQGIVAPDSTVAVPFEILPNNRTLDTLDVWYGGADRLDVAVRTPAGDSSGVVHPGDPAVTFDLPNGNRVYVESTTSHPLNGQNQIYLQLMRGTRSEIERGTWKLELTGAASNVRFDAWIEDQLLVKFLQPSQEGTITVPGNSRKIITVGSYVTDSDLSEEGALAENSSRGPTRDGRDKPELTAPGQKVVSARANRQASDDPYRAHSGTSMAAPHVAGTIALLLEKCPSLDQGEILSHLVGTARTDSFTNNPPKSEWGAGKLDAEACHAAVP